MNVQHVLLEVADLTKPSRAEFTLEWLLFAVHSDVVLEVAFFTEDLETSGNLALEQLDEPLGSPIVDQMSTIVVVLYCMLQLQILVADDRAFNGIH